MKKHDNAALILENDELVGNFRPKQLLELLNEPSFEAVNKKLQQLSGVQHFFANSKEFEDYKQFLISPIPKPIINSERQWGDFQTPPQLATQVCELVAATNFAPKIIIEPTYGVGNFIFAAAKIFPQLELIYGVEIQARHVWNFKINWLSRILEGYSPTIELDLHQADIFTHQFPAKLLAASDILILGNPPWVTNAELSLLAADNLPTKRNLKALNGLDALTGKSNFDISETIVLRLLQQFSKRRGRLAMLLKCSTIKNLIEILPKMGFSTADIKAYNIDANSYFGAAVEAALLTVELGAQQTNYLCSVAFLDNPNKVERIFVWTDNKFVADNEKYLQTSQYDGKSSLIWRQGLKHDCAKIMELTSSKDSLLNGSNQLVDVESNYVYPLLKTADLKDFEVIASERKVIVTQRQINENTTRLKN